MEVATTRLAVCQLLDPGVKLIVTDGTVAYSCAPLGLEYVAEERRVSAEQVLVYSEGFSVSTDLDCGYLTSESGSSLTAIVVTRCLLTESHCSCEC